MVLSAESLFFASEIQDDEENSVNKGSNHGSTTSGSGSSIGHSEGRLVNRSKIVLYVTLCLAGVCVSLATFFFVKHQEKAAFESEFRNLANEIIDIATSNTRNTIGQVRSISTSYASYASQSPVNIWPNVTLPHFDERVRESIALTGAELIAFLPIVSKEHKASYEAFVRNEYSRFGLADAADLPQEIHSIDGEPLEKDVFAPIWQTAPAAISTDILLLDMDALPWFQEVEDDVLRTKHAIMSRVVDIDFLLDEHEHGEESEMHPHTIVLDDIPSFIGDSEAGENEPDAVGFVMALMPWELYFTNVIPSDIHGFLVEVNDHCGGVFTYEINGHNARVTGKGSLHSSKYDYLHQQADWSTIASPGDGILGTNNPENLNCYYTLDVYPTDKLKALYTSSNPFTFASAILAVFVFIIIVFFCYDFVVQRRQQKVQRIAKQTANIVKSLFPKNVQDRIMEEAKAAAEADNEGQRGFRFSNKERLKNALQNGEDNEERHKNAPPIADLFPSTTIMFADLVGFTAWSSMREPAQVFQLLETIYSEFDEIARKRRIFKVETVGDCYVAACGIPDPRRDHAVAMVRFARDCRNRMMALMTNLEITLGPDTGELGLRIGLHSGPVTGGVLRGEKARFQLFGDTMNTTARIETTGKKNMIHISEETANILQAFGKGHWTRLREDKVNAKGKGELTTYWLVKADGPQSTSSGIASSDGDEDESNNAETDVVCSVKVVPIETSALTEKAQRLVKWNADVISRILKDVIQRRQSLGVVADLDAVRKLEEATQVGQVFGEITEILALPTFNAEAAARQESMPTVTLDSKVTEQLEVYIHAIATLYHDNSFHNFDHVSHVTMSVTKLFSRIVAPEVSGDERTLHDHTYGITSDPLTQFAAAFAALIHDVDHQGVTNATLIEENSPIAAVYNNKSIAEQNSVDIAWSLLLDDSFVDLRNCIYTTPAEYNRFRQLIVNLVMATDIMDKSLSQARKDRWAKAFSESNGSNTEEELQEQINRKATIVLEHVIQASDVSHTMQHWHIYRKWNARLFEEMMNAYRQGRTKQNPADRWYEGEIGFFDFYIIPLAKKLKECGVFGVSSDEYLNYAETNRKEWEAKGREVVAEMVAKLQ